MNCCDRSPGSWPRTLVRVVGCLVCFVLSGCARNEPYPNAPLTLIVPWGVGGGTDRVSRQMARFLEEELHVPVNVVNATGGRGVTGHSRGLHARPDGYTVTMMTLELNMLHWQDLTTISWKDGIPLVSVNEDAADLFVRDDSPYRSVQDLASAVKEAKGRMTASGTASGGAWHLATSVWLESAGLNPADVKWIPMNGSSSSLQELLSGGIDLVCCSLPEAKTQLESKQVRCLGVMSDERAPGFEDVPTMKEQGYNVRLVGWRGFAVPRETPTDRVERLVAAMERVVTGVTRIDGKTFPGYMQSQGFNARWRKGEELTRFLSENDADFGRIYQNPQMVQHSGGRVSPWAFPRMLAIVGGVLLSCLGIGRWRRRAAAAGKIDRGDAGALSLEPAAAARLSWRGIANFLAVLGMVLAFLLLAEPLGFLAVMGVSLFGLLRLLGNGWFVSLLTSAMVTPAVQFLFATLLSVPLPRGWWIS